jgi:8-oxo-dGTP pyrophosphatase MutT (NUDIX family)
MAELPLGVAIISLIDQNKILLIQRTKGDYVGLWGLLGGKIEKGEHISDTAIRELLEESGINAKFVSYLGCISEHLVENEKVTNHFMLHLCELKPITTQINNQENKLAWFDLDKLGLVKEKIIPSDLLIIERMIKNRNSSYYNCILEKKEDSYILKKFE